MKLYWLSTAIALAVSVSAGVVRDVSPVKQLTARQGSVITQKTVTSYFQTSTTAIRTCNGQISTISQAQVQTAVTTITTTVQTITKQLPRFQQCACGPLGRDVSFGQMVKGLFIEFQALVDAVNLRFSASLDDFRSCWTLFQSYFQRMASFTAVIQLDLSRLLRGVLNLDILAKIGINLNVLGINLGVGVGLGVGIN